MSKRQTISASDIPGGLPPGITPSLELISSSKLAEHLGMSHAGMDRLIKRRQRELRTYGPLLRGHGHGTSEVFLTVDQADVLTLVSETPLGAANRLGMLTAATLTDKGFDVRDPHLMEFRNPDEVRRSITRGPVPPEVAR